MFLVTDTLTSLENCKIHSISFLILNDKISGLHFGYAAFGCKKNGRKKDWMQKKNWLQKRLDELKGWVFRRTVILTPPLEYSAFLRKQ